MKFFIRAFITSGIIFAFVTAISLHGFFGGGWLNSLLVGVVMGSLSGSIFAILAHLSKRYIRFTDFRFAAGGIILMSVMGVLTGVLIFQVVDNLPTGSWEKLPNPSEKPVKFALTELTKQTGYLYIYTEKGNLYAYPCTQNDPRCKWIMVDPATMDRSRRNFADCEINYGTPSLPGRIIDFEKFNICGADGAAQENYVITEDGTIWEWGKGSSGFDVLFYPIFGLIGLIAGFLTGALLFIKLPSKSKQNNVIP
jgi:hypothetical protein